MKRNRIAAQGPLSSARSRLVKQHHERGAVLIEFILVVPVLLLFSLGVVEMGMAWKASTDVNASVRDAARAGSSSGPKSSADETILRTLGASLSPTELTQVQAVVVFKAQGSDGKMSNDCKSAVTPPAILPLTGTNARGSNGSCNIYSLDQVEAALAGTGNFGGGGGAWDRRWRPQDRKNSMGNGGPDYLGVYIKIKHGTLTHSFWNDMSISHTAVFRLQPAYEGP